MQSEQSFILPDLLKPGLRLVFCGSAAGRVSALVGAPYAGPGNKFWPMLYRTGLTPRLFRPDEFRSLLDLGIGLTDLAKHEFGADSDLSKDAYDPDALRRRIEPNAPRVLAFVGLRPARVFLHAQFGVRMRDVRCGWQPQTLGTTRLYALPSPSGLAIRWWDEAPWHALAEYMKSL